MNKNRLLYIAAAVSATTAAVYSINKLIHIKANAKSTLANSNGLHYDWRYGKIFYTKQGTGKPVLLVHDLTCGSSDVEWKCIVNKYAKTNTVYTLDLIGCGRSDKPSLTYTNYLYVQLITDFVKNVINHRTDVVVTGRSCSFVLMSCFNDNTLFDKIILINPSGINCSSPYISGGNRILKKLIELPVIGTTIYNIKNRKSKYCRLFSKSYCCNPHSVKKSLIQAYYDAAHYGTMTSKYLYGSISSNYTNVNISRALKNINNSIFIIGSDGEPNIKETLRTYAELNPSVEETVIHDVCHLPQLEKPDEILKAIRIFTT